MYVILVVTYVLNRFIKLSAKSSLPLFLDKLTDYGKGIILLRLSKNKLTHIVELILNLAELSCFPLDAYSEIGLKSRHPYLKLNMSVTFYWLVKSRQRK